MDEKLINTNEEANKAKETAISPDVAFSNQQPIKLPNKPKQNATLSFEPFIASAQQNIDQATKTRDEGMTNLKEISDLLGNQGNRQIQMEEQSGVKTLREDVTRLDSLISSKTQQYRTEMQNLEGQNIASSFITGQQNRLNVLATRELANLSIIRDSQSGRLEDAQAWVKAKVDAETSQLKSKLEFQQFVYQENKEILNKEQDKKFSLQIKQTEQAYADEKEKQEKIQNMSLTAAQYGASPEALDQISGATNFEDALNKAGKYLGAEFRLKVDMQEFNKRMAQASLSLQREQFNFQRSQASSASAEKKQAEAAEMARMEKLLVDGSKDTIQKVNNILGNQRGINTASGVTGAQRGFLGSLLGQVGKQASLGLAGGVSLIGSNPFKDVAAQREVTAKVAQVLDEGWVKTVAEAKANGVALAGMSDAEGTRMSNAYSALSNVAKRNESGQIIYFNASPDFVASELKAIQDTANEVVNRRANELFETSETILSGGNNMSNPLSNALTETGIGF